MSCADTMRTHRELDHIRQTLGDREEDSWPKLDESKGIV